MDKFTTCLWYDGNAEEAAKLYTSLFPDSRIVSVERLAADAPGLKEGDVVTVEFELGGRSFVGLNGGPQFPFTEAVSFQIACADQEEVDRLWAALSNGGSEGRCGWVKDQWGLSWQVIPTRLHELLADRDPKRARRAMEAMLKMNKIIIADLERAAAGH